MTWLYEVLLSPFVDFAFMRRALAGCMALAVGAAPVGVFLMLRRMSLAGDAMAHAILPGAAVGFLMSGLKLIPMTIGGMIAGMTVAVLSGVVARITSLREDASLAAFYLISLALGVLIVSMNGTNVDLLHVLFGSVLALDDTALYFLAGAATLSLVLLAIIYRALIAECVDPQFLGIISRSGGAAHMIFLLLVVLNLVAGFQALGTLLAVGMMMLPAVTSRFWAKTLNGMLAVSIGVGVLASVVGLLASYHTSAPSGPAITLAAGAAYIVSLLLGPQGGIVWQLMPTRHRTA
jgi:zinc/manganese transport system permease protein